MMTHLAAAAKRFRENLEELPLQESFVQKQYNSSGRVVATKRGTYNLTFQSSAALKERDIRRHARGSSRGERNTGLIDLVVLPFEAEMQPASVFHLLRGSRTPGLAAIRYSPRHPRKVEWGGNRVSSLHFSGSLRGQLSFNPKNFLFIRASAEMVGLPAHRRLGAGFYKGVLEELRIVETFEELLPPGDSEPVLAPREVTLTMITNRGRTVSAYRYSLPAGESLP